MKFLAIVLLSIALPASSFAKADKTFSVDGYVDAFDSDKIYLVSGVERIEVPKKLYQFKVVAGERISVPMDDATFASLKREKLKPTPK